MIKSIRDRKALRPPYRWGRQVKVFTTFFVCLASNNGLFSHPEITIRNLAPQSIEQLHEFSKNNPGGLTIHLVPEKKWLETVTGFLATPFTTLRNAFSLKNVSLTLVSGALSLGWISYLLCTYFIYKTYRVVKNVHSWANWCSDDELLSDYDALYLKFDQHKRTRPSKKKYSLRLMTLQQEKELLTFYLRLDMFLKKHNLRHHFPHSNKKTQIQINCAYTKLQKAEALLVVRKKRMHL